MPSIPLPAHPLYIHFETDGKDMIIHYAGKKARNRLSSTTKNEEFIIILRKF
jgi:hypothetical protein